MDPFNQCLSIVTTSKISVKLFTKLGWYYLPTPPLGQDMTQGQFLTKTGMMNSKNGDRMDQKNIFIEMYIYIHTHESMDYHITCRL